MKQIASLILMLCSIMSVSAQDMKSLFISMPDLVAPLLTKVNREDCVDFLVAKMEAKVKNKLGKVSQLDTLTADYLHLTMTKSSVLEMKLLPVNDSTRVVCLVKTVKAPVSDSDIAFFDTQWNPLEEKDYLESPEAELFFLQADSLNVKDEQVRALADLHLLDAKLSVEKQTLTFSYNTSQYLNKEDRKKLEKILLMKPVEYKWENGRFIQE